MRVVWMYGAMHLKSTSATPILIVLSVTPVPIVFEIGALLPDDPEVGVVVVRRTRLRAAPARREHQHECKRDATVTR